MRGTQGGKRIEDTTGRGGGREGGGGHIGYCNWLRPRPTWPMDRRKVAVAGHTAEGATATGATGA
jgi:hypothetical protein